MRAHDQLIQTDFTRLDGAKIKVSYNAYNQLVLDYEGKTWEKVKTMRPFPLSSPDRCVFFRDKEGMEIGYIADLKETGAATRETIEKELALYYFTTSVNSIEEVKTRHGVTTWTLNTARGRKVVHVRDRNDIRSLPGRRMIFTDTSGMRYEIANIESLDDKSQGLLEAET